MGHPASSPSPRLEGLLQVSVGRRVRLTGGRSADRNRGAETQSSLRAGGVSFICCYPRCPAPSATRAQRGLAASLASGSSGGLSPSFSAGDDAKAWPRHVGCLSVSSFHTESPVARPPAPHSGPQDGPQGGLRTQGPKGRKVRVTERHRDMGSEVTRPCTLAHTHRAVNAVL